MQPAVFTRQADATGKLELSGEVATPAFLPSPARARLEPARRAE